jgi:hypothetical protein
VEVAQRYGKKRSIYVLRTEWNKVYLKNELDIGDVVQVWSFWLGSKQELRLALVVVSRCGGDGKERGRKSTRGSKRNSEEDASTSLRGKEKVGSGSGSFRDGASSSQRAYVRSTFQP